MKQVKKRVPMASIHFEKAREIFKEYDTDSDETLSINELTEALVEIGHKITTLPAVSTDFLSDARFSWNFWFRLRKSPLSKVTI